MYRTTVPVLDRGPAIELSTRLLEGEAIPTRNLLAAAQGIATSMNGFPYYIHHLVDRMKLLGLQPDSTSADSIVAACL